MSASFFRRSLVRCAVVLAGAVFVCASLAAAPAKKNPSWSELTPEQQQTLKPLAGEWDQMDRSRRTKWIGIAKRYPQMTPTGQKRVQSRMAAWVNLTPDKRREAREQYRKIGTLPPEKREVVAQQWKEYQNLPDHVKKNLAAEPQKKAEKIEPRKRTKTAHKKKPAASPAQSKPASEPLTEPAPVAAPPAVLPASTD